MGRIRAGALALLCILFGSPAGAETTLVFAAASLTDVLSDLAQGFEDETGHEVVLSYAASSVLARQIENGAPAALFVSASTAWMDYLGDRGLIDPESRVDVARNRLVLAAAPGMLADLRIADLSTRLRAGIDGKVAIADPAHVPAGIYAREALESLGLWAVAEPHLARMADVRAALTLLRRGEAVLGIVYASDAAALPDVVALDTFPADSHAPIVYPAATVAAGTDPVAVEFLDFLAGRRARDAFDRAGFSAADGGP